MIFEFSASFSAPKAAADRVTCLGSVFGNRVKEALHLLLLRVTFTKLRLTS